MEGGYTGREMKLVLLACCLSGFVTPLLSTMMNLSLVGIGEEFAVGSHMLGYVNTAFLLSSVVFMVPLSKAADIVGKSGCSSQVWRSSCSPASWRSSRRPSGGSSHAGS